MKRIFLFLALLVIGTSLKATEVVYTVVKDDAVGTVVNAFGEKPEGSDVFFLNEFGDTPGNRYNQVAKDKSAYLELYGWRGCTIESITFNMCSNKTSGGALYTVTVDDVEIFKQRAAFNDSTWYGEWVGHQNGIYVDIKKSMQNLVEIDDEQVVKINIKGTESSVYINSFAIEYTASDEVETESPMGYVYERIPKNGSVAEGDNVIIYYKSMAASDLVEGTNSYLSIYPVKSTNNVFEPELSYFTMIKNGSSWQFVNQYGELLGAKGEKKLAWDEGVTTWDIKFTFDGAEIKSTNENYGQICFNTQTGDRFTTYGSTGKTIVLPSLYCRVRQNQPIVATSLTLPEERIVYINQDSAVLKPTILPQNVTDKRVVWESKNNEIATVRDGIVKPVSLGTTEITVATLDGSLTASCRIVVEEEPIIEGIENAELRNIYTENGRIFGIGNAKIFNLLGQDVTKENGNLKGVYVVKIGNHAVKVSL